MRPNSLDYSAQARAKTMTDAMNGETFDFNLLLIEQLYQQGFSFKVVGVESSAKASSAWLKAELEILEKHNVKWDVIPRSYFEEVINTFQKWRK